MDFTLDTGAKGRIDQDTLNRVAYSDVKKRIEDILRLFPSYQGEKVIEITCK